MRLRPIIEQPRRVHRAALGVAAFLVLVALSVLAAYFARTDRSTSAAPETPSPTSRVATPTTVSPSAPTARRSPPSTHDPIAFAKAAAVALWSYDTRTGSQADSLTTLHTWMTGEKQYAATASVDALVPSPVLWKEMAADHQYATAGAAEGHFPASFAQALRADPGAITTAYVYAVTVTGEQSIGWKGTPHDEVEPRSVTLAVQCRPEHDCALAGALPNVAP